MLYPLLWMLAASFRPENEIFTSASIWPSSWSIDAYIRGWNGLRTSFSHLLSQQLHHFGPVGGRQCAGLLDGGLSPLPG